jgi:homoserine O-succinyltransferase
MPIRLPDGLPARCTPREEGIEIGDPDGGCPVLRPLRIALLNLMPCKAVTETQIARLLGRSPFEVELSLIGPDL